MGGDLMDRDLPLAQAVLNVEEARRLRAAGQTYRQIRHHLGISPGQLAHIRRALKREKAGGTTMRSRTPGASDRDLPIGRSILSAGLRRTLIAAGFATLGDLADRLDDTTSPGLQTLPGIGPHRLALVRRLLGHYDLLPGSGDLRAEIESLFPELGDDDEGSSTG